MDQGSDLIRKAILTSADIGESIAADASSAATRRPCWRTRPTSRWKADALAEAGITDRIMHRRHQAKRTPAWHKWMNVAIAPLRGQEGSSAP